MKGNDLGYFCTHYFIKKNKILVKHFVRQFIVSIADPRLDLNVFEDPRLPQLEQSPILPGKGTEMRAEGKEGKKEEEGGMQPI